MKLELARKIADEMYVHFERRTDADAPESAKGKYRLVIDGDYYADDDEEAREIRDLLKLLFEGQ